MSDSTASHDPRAPLIGDPSVTALSGDDLPPLSPPTTADELGRLGPYRLLSRLGAGGRGVVFAAADTTLNRPVALKVMRERIAADPNAREQFLREARAAAAVRHDHIVTVYHAGEDGGILFIAFELLDGTSLDRWLKAFGRADPAEATRIGREVAAGLAAAHAAGLVHRDVKPSNVWLEGPSRRAKILDFGLAALIPPATQLVGDGSLTGTPAYMSPEQAEGRPLDHRTDLFSLGAILYELATGRRPFAGPSVSALLEAIVACQPGPVRTADPTVPPGLAEVIDLLLKKSPEHRYQSAETLRDKLRTVEIDLRTRAALARTGLTRAGEQVIRTDVSEPATDGTAVARVLVEAAPPADGWRQSQPPKRKKRWVTVLVVLGTLSVFVAVSPLFFLSYSAHNAHDTMPVDPREQSALHKHLHIRPEAAEAFVGTPVIVEFVVDRVDEGDPVTLRPVEGPGPDAAGRFAVELPLAVVRDQVPPGGDVRGFYQGRTVRVTGTVERAPGGGTVIKVQTPSQLELPQEGGSGTKK